MRHVTETALAAVCFALPPALADDRRSINIIDIHQGSVLSDMGLSVHVGEAEAAAHGAYAQMHASDALKKKKAA